jgi:glycosyltransferase involved in cell wall biosynthesis
VLLSVIVPAFNEELYLPRSLPSLRRAAAECKCSVELIVVDNASTDRTAEMARASGARVVYEPVHNVARVRNAGAATAYGEVLVFVDADTKVPHEFLDRVNEAMTDPQCLGGSADIVHHVRSKILRAYLGAWRWTGSKLGMAQGAAQFCRASAFRVLNGYDESQFMGEDVDFYWRLRKMCARTRGHVQFLSGVKVVPSPRRFDTAPVWRTLIWTNPVFIWAFRKSRSAWAQWYATPPR